MIHSALFNEIERSTKELGYAFPSGVLLDTPPHGVAADVATNIALQLSRQEAKSPRDLAQSLKLILEKAPGIESIEIAGPGFLNITVDRSVLAASLKLSAQLPVFKPCAEKIIVEFISANPTGKLHIGNARGGPIGETLSRVLERVGYTVSREFYVNDIGGQADTFARSVLHFYAKNFGVTIPFPEKGYPELIITDVVRDLVEKYGDTYLSLEGEEQLSNVRAVSVECIMEHNKKTIAAMGIHFDRYYYQSELILNGTSIETLNALKQKDAVVEKDGALWLKSGVMEDDRETVLVKSNGVTTYFLDDIAYHKQKLIDRGFAKAVVLLGANHFGHTPRMRAGLLALGIDPLRYEGLLYQQVQLKRDGEAIKMAKRDGNVVTADEVLVEVSRDVFTYFMLSKSSDSHIDFDLQLAKDTSEKNPIFYIQYAHARIRSVLRLALERSMTIGDTIPAEVELTETQRVLLLWLDSYRACIEGVSENYRTHSLALYAYELATKFHHFYAHQRIITDDAVTTSYLLYLCQVTADTLEDVLHLMNIEALDSM